MLLLLLFLALFILSLIRFGCRREIGLSGTEAQEMTDLSSESFSPAKLQLTASIGVEWVSLNSATPLKAVQN